MVAEPVRPRRATDFAKQASYLTFWYRYTASW